MVERERRKGPRYPVRFRAYFPEFELQGLATNISLEGCYVQVTSNMEKEGRVDLIIELPVVGPILLNGYVHYQNDYPSPGVGLQFIHVGFSAEESIYYGVFSRFIKVLSQLQDVRDYYHKLADQEGIEPSSIPEATSG